jgi:hypothetical protein
VPPHLEVPPALRKRVGPRIARNVAVAAVAAAVIVVGVVAGLRSLNEAPTTQSLGSATETPSVTGPLPCSAGDLFATVSFEGAMGSRDGTIDLRNDSAKTCTLRGFPTVALEDSSERPIGDLQVQDGSPSWKLTGAKEPDGWPLVTLAPGDTGSTLVRWSNWCASEPTMILTNEEGDQVSVIDMPPDSVPPCNGPGMPSPLEIGPFEPQPPGA